MQGKRCDISGKFYKTGYGESSYDDYALIIANNNDLESVINFDISREVLDELVDWIESKQAQAIANGNLELEEVKKLPWRKNHILNEGRLK